MNTTLGMKKRLPNREFRKLIPKLRKKGFYKPKKKRQIDWKRYNKSQTEEAIILLSKINQLTDSCEVKKLSTRGRKGVDTRILAKVILLCEALQLTERQAQGWINVLASNINLTSKLDDRTIGRAYNSLEVQYLLKQVFEKTKDSNGELMGDGTGIETTRKQNYESDKLTSEYFTSIIDSREIVQTFDFSGEDERLAIDSLVEEVEGDSLRLDAGFNDKELVRKIVEKGIIPYVYPKKINRINDGNGWTEMYLEFFMDVIAWLTEYYQRVHCESFHSAFKRVYGIIRKIRVHSKFVQVSARIILHNRARLSYFKKIK